MFGALFNEPRVLVIQHTDRAPGGNFCRGLEARGARLFYLNPMEKDRIPQTSDGYDGLVVLGGSQHAFDDVTSPHFPALMDLMRLFDDKKKPVAGICLGCQLLARAYGGRVWTLDSMEFGFIQHGVTEAGMLDPVIGGLELPELMEFHEDSFDLPPRASLLVRGDRCANQCFRVGHASFGFQFHLEADTAIIRRWVDLFRNGAFVDYRRHLQHFDDAYFEDFSGRIASRITGSERFCHRVTGRWLALIRQ